MENFSTYLVLCFLLTCVGTGSCKKEEATPVPTTTPTTTSATKCTSITILDTLKSNSSQQLYYSATFKNNGVGAILNSIISLKDKKGKVRVKKQGVLYEYTVTLKIISDTGVELISSEGVLVSDGSPAIDSYLSDDYYFFDNNCHINVYAVDASSINKYNDVTLINITNDPKLASILKSFDW